MGKSRNRKLLENAAKCFEEQRSPFAHGELLKHDVTADECIELSQSIADAIRAYLDAGDRLKQYAKNRSQIQRPLKLDNSWREK